MGGKRGLLLKSVPYKFLSSSFLSTCRYDCILSACLDLVFVNKMPVQYMCLVPHFNQRNLTEPSNATTTHGKHPVTLRNIIHDMDLSKSAFTGPKVENMIRYLTVSSGFTRLTKIITLFSTVL